MKNLLEFQVTLFQIVEKHLCQFEQNIKNIFQQFFSHYLNLMFFQFSSVFH